jgi:hypothetical protein
MLGNYRVASQLAAPRVVLSSIQLVSSSIILTAVHLCYIYLVQNVMSHLLNSIKSSRYYIYHMLQHTKALHSSQTVYLCVPDGSQNKQRLFPQTT